MERLLADAQELSGIEYDIENLSDVYNAIHVIQTELGITGTTAKEADATISGSFASMKAALDNFITGFGDENADMDKLFGNLMDSADVFLNDNLIPTVERILKTVIDKIPEMLPKLIETLGTMISNLAPSLVASTKILLKKLLSTVLDFIPGMTDDIKKLANETLDELFDTLEEVFELISDTAEDVLPVVIEAISIIVKSVGSFTRDVLPPLAHLLSVVFDVLKPILDVLEPIVGFVTDLAGGLIGNLVDGLAQFFGFDYGEKAKAEFAKMSDAEQDVIDKTAELKGEQEALRNSFTSTIKKVSEEMKSKRTLEDLKRITTETGEIRKGCQYLAETYANELNSELGTNLEIEGNRIANYEEQLGLIDQLIEKERARRTLEAAESDYNKAKEEREAQQEELDNAALAIADERQKLNELKKKRDEYVRDLAAGGLVLTEDIFASNEYKELSGAIEGTEQKIKKLQGTQSDLKDTMALTNAEISNFEALGTAIAENSTEKMSEALKNLEGGFVTAENGTEETLKRQYSKWQTELDRLKRLVNNKGSGVTQEMVSNAQQMVDRSGYELTRLGVVYDGAMSDTVDRVSRYADSLRESGANIGSNFIDSMASTIEAQSYRVRSAVDAIASGLAEISPNVKINSAWDISAYSTPKVGHAKGGIVTREHIARVGEDGAEAIIPLEHNTEWIDRVAERLNGSGSGDVIAKLDELISSIKSLKIYLDGEALVGGIAPAMDKKLGSISRLKRRSAV